MEALLETLGNLSLHSKEDVSAIKIQKVYRRYITRRKYLPLVLYKIQKYLQAKTIELDTKNEDGRINSCSDEQIIIDLLKDFKCKIPKVRNWYDLLVYDNFYGWIPVNIKTTTMKTSDNTGNLAMCVYSYTDHVLDLDKTYNNGEMSEILFTKLQKKEYNKTRKNYYFLVINKLNTKDIIINSVLHLSYLTPNNNNLPFQVCWDKNRKCSYKSINENVKIFLQTLQKPKPCWKEIFLEKIRSIEA